MKYEVTLLTFFMLHGTSTIATRIAEISEELHAATDLVHDTHDTIII
jgi:hypothetical protein